MKASQVPVTSDHLFARAERAMPGGSLTGFRGPPDQAIVLDHGLGARVFGHDGREWIDYMLGSGPLLLGHRHEAVVRAVEEQAARGFSFYVLNEPAILLAEAVNRAVPCAEQTRFAGSGAEATFYAMRIARAATGRKVIIKMEGGYHGHNDYAMMSHQPVVDTPFPRAVPDCAGIPDEITDLVHVVPFNSPDDLQEALERNHREVAAVIIEPYQRAIPPQPGYLEQVRELTQRNGVLLIFDEIVTGFRLSYGGAQQYYGVVPDLCTVGKVLGGGLPLAAVCGPRDLLRLTSLERKGKPDYVYFSGTLNGNCLSAAAGLATLHELRKPKVYEQLFALGERMRAGLQDALTRQSVSAQVLGDGPMFYVEYTDYPVFDYRTSRRGDKAFQRLVGTSLIEEGHLVNPSQRGYISSAHTEADIDETVDAFEAVVKKLRREKRSDA